MIAEAVTHAWAPVIAYTGVAVVAVGCGRCRRYSVMGAGLVSARALMGYSLAGGLLAASLWALQAGLRIAVGWSHPYLPWWANNSVESISTAAVISVAVMAPVAEELVFRGVLYRAMRRRFSVAPSIAVATILFVVGHSAPSVVPALLLGVATAVAYERSQTVWAPMALHAATNSTLLLFALGAFHVGGVPGEAM